MWASRANQVLAQGQTGTNSKRLSHYPQGIPSHLSQGRGCYVWDYQGKKYLDFVSGLGAVILGYNHPKVTEAVKAQIDKGLVSTSLPTTLEVQTAELVRDVFPQIEKLRFLKTGSEACSASVKIARTYTRKLKVVSNNYHGWHDTFQSLEEPGLGVWKDQGVIRDKNALNGSLIVEPIALSAEKKEYIGTCVIFDEVITGLRVPKNSVGQWWKASPDITCLGKAIANGFPLAIVGGKKEVMDCGEYFISSTYSGEAVSLAACKATLEEIKKNNNVDDLWYYGERLRTKLNELHPEIKFDGYGTRAQLNLFESRTAAIFAQQAAKAGILFGRAWFFNYAHLEEDIESNVLSICGDIVRKIERKEVDLEGQMPRGSFVR